MEEIRFTNLKTMVDCIKEHTQKNCSYVVPYEDLKNKYCGWYCEKTKTSFVISDYNLLLGNILNRGANKVNNNKLLLELDSPLKRKIACINLSNCANDREYQSLIEKINKLKAFW